MPTKFNGRENRRQGKVYKAAFIWVNQGHYREEPCLIGPPCYCVSLNKSEGCELDRQPLPRAFNRQLLLSSGGNVERLLDVFVVQPVLTTYYLKSARRTSTDVPTTNLSLFTQTTALFAFMAQRKLFPFTHVLDTWVNTTGTAACWSHSTI